MMRPLAAARSVRYKSGGQQGVGGVPVGVRGPRQGGGGRPQRRQTRSGPRCPPYLDTVVTRRRRGMTLLMLLQSQFYG